MAVRTTPEYSGDFSNIDQPLSPISSYARRIKDGSLGAMDSVGESYMYHVVGNYRRIIPSPILRFGLNLALGAIAASALTVGVVALAQHNGADQSKPKIETPSKPAVGPKSPEDCEAFSAGDDWFAECMRQRAIRTQSMTP